MGKKVVTLGEIMLRLSTPGNTRFVQSDSFDVVYGGGEANVAVSCANYGHDAYFVTKLPKHEIGQSAVNALRKYGVKTDFIARGGDRVGIYYLETGASMRPSKVIYDRAHSAIAEADAADFDFDAIMEGADWFHWSGIQDALVAYSDFNISVNLSYYDPFDYHSFGDVARNILEQKPDGIMFAPTVPQYTKPFTEELNKRSIPYIYIDSNLKDQPALSFFGQNSHQSGYFAARMMMLLAGGEREIVIFRKINEGIVGSNQQERREIGFREYMLKHHSDCRIWELNLHAKRDSDDAQMLNDFFRKHPNVKNGITFNSKVYIVGEYLLKQQKTDFKLMGYDLLERNVKCLMEGSVSFLIAQQPELQGFDGIKALCDYLIFKKEVPRENFMPIDLLTKENIEFYSNK